MSDMSWVGRGFIAAILYTLYTPPPSCAHAQACNTHTLIRVPLNDLGGVCE